MGCSEVPRIGKYEFQENIGLGTYGKIIAVKSRENSEKLVIKRMKIRCRDIAEREISYLENLSSEYIVQIKQHFRDRHFINIVLEKCDFSLDQEYIVLAKEKKESYQKQIIKAVKYLHSRDVFHRDLKLQNILTKQNKIKIIDFGLSNRLSNDSKTEKSYGTDCYQSPEFIATGCSSKQSDCWALGLVLMEMQLRKRVYEFIGGCQIPAQDPKFPSKKDFEQIQSAKMRRIIKGLLQRCPKNRISAQQAERMLEEKPNKCKLSKESQN